ncbi:MAG: NAD-dependent epimerase/dehydratase family protein [Paludibacter sp.]|jgi:nucleoside-diphosphate-sugar epimerase|nr:NAD-dependent epimerase/dehydratase family protein [Paludibacter sp.]
MIMVTGATGLVGSHLLWRLLQEEERVVAIMRYTSSLRAVRAVFASYTDEPDTYLCRIDWRVAAVNNPEALDKALDGVTEVFHCAAVVSLGGNSDSIADVNVEGTRLLVDLCLRKSIQRFYFVSSIAACGSYDEQRPIDENAPWIGMDQKSLYAQTKYLAEQEVWMAMRKGLSAAIVNPGVILGFSGVDSGSSMLFHRVRKGLPFYIDGGSGYVGVKDVVTALLLIRKKGIAGERYVLVSENTTNKEILSSMARGFGKRPPRIRIGLSLLIFTGKMMSIAGKIFGFNPPLNETSARSSTNHVYFSSEKAKNHLHMDFTPVKMVIDETCEIMIKQDR